VPVYLLDSPVLGLPEIADHLDSAERLFDTFADAQADCHSPRAVFFGRLWLNRLSGDVL
jgi:hypothetical protein